MKLNILKKIEYRGYRIHVMQFKNVFQYLITDKDKNLYQDNITFPPSILNKIKFKLRLTHSLYTKEEMKIGEDIVLNGATLSIDALIGGKGFKVESKKKFSKKSKCMWRVLKENEEWNYECLTHGVIMPMKDGKKPSHKF